jgi:putative MATE family efflux protein
MSSSISFRKDFIRIAIPVALQGLLHSSFSMVDQIMVGQLGEVSIAGIGLAGKFSSLYSVLLTAIATVAGIMLAQYIGKNDDKEIGKSFYLNLCFAVGLAVLFLMLCMTFPQRIMRIYTTDQETKETAALYLMIVAAGYLPRAFSLLYATLLRCKSHASIPLYATAFNAVVDTVLSYVLIFGKFGFPKMGVAGAAIGTVVAQIVECVVIIILYLRLRKKECWKMPFSIMMTKNRWIQYAGILVPILVCEFFWSLGENVYAVIYGHIGTKSCAAMTLISPMVILFMGLMGGVSQAAGILTGKRLGAKEYDIAYKEAKRMMRYGIVGSIVLSLSLILFGRYYVSIFQVKNEVHVVAYQLLVVFAILAPIKVQNMILGGGIIRSGGKTNYIMVIDLIGTWGFGVPLGLLSAFVLKLPITPVYLILSMEECVRLIITLCVFKRRKWMCRL